MYTKIALAAAMLVAGTQAYAATGPSSSATPYVTPTAAGWSVTSILTVGDAALNGYKMVGIPDGLGAYDAGGQFIGVTMNHELGNTSGIARAHGNVGAFVSHWLIDKNNMQVVAGGDLAKKVMAWNGSAFVETSTTFNRLCSADLPMLSAFYNPSNGKGYQGLIHMNGEESGDNGRAFGFVVTGINRGTAYELPYLGKFSWENSVANPYSGDKTVVIGTDDSTPGQVYMYVGNKQTNGNAVEQAGLHNGQLYGIKVAGVATETGAINGNFSMAAVNWNQTGTALQSESVTNGVTQFARPEDGHWADADTFYFVTTGTSTGGSAKLYRLDYSNANDLTLGGTITMVKDSNSLTGTDGANARSFDNMYVNGDTILIQEDPGNSSYIAKTWMSNDGGKTWTQILESDRARFYDPVIESPNILPAGVLTIDEESSGIIEITHLMTDSAMYKPGYRFFLGDMQAHYDIAGELVQGGQLYLVAQVPEPETYAMMLAGLGLVGFMARRRRSA